MKIMATLYKTMLWMAMMLFMVQIGSSQEYVSKTVERSFPLNGKGELLLENKYGTINVTGWNQNKVSVKVDIKVNHRKKDAADDLLQRINPVIKSNSSSISIVSEISNKNTGWFADFFNRNNPIDVDRSRVQIDYEVFLPKGAKLKVSNRFGDVVLDDWSGELNSLIEHGDLWVSEDLNRAAIVLKFGKVKARNLNYASFDLKNGELDMLDSKSLRLNSSGTEMKLGHINSLEIYSSKDDITVEEAGTIYGSLKFSTIQLNRLSQNVDLSMKIADFRIQKITDTGADLNIEQESSEILIGVTKFPHRFDATLEQGVVRLPRSYKNVDSKLLDKGKRLREIRATFGNDPKGRITINGMKGIVTINE